MGKVRDLISSCQTYLHSSVRRSDNKHNGPDLMGFALHITKKEKIVHLFDIVL